MKWHKYENQERYDEMIEKGLTNRYEAKDGESFYLQFKDKNLTNNLFESTKLPPPADVLVIGTGTGADACILADMGYRVTAVDIIDEAIIQAKINAKSIDTDVKFIQDDIIDSKYNYSKYDIIFSSYCLQSIVTDSDRNAYYNFVINHMKNDGKHIIVSAGYSPNKDYSGDILDKKTGILLSPVPENDMLDDISIIDGKSYAPSRRHYTINQLSDELRKFGFEIIYDGCEKLHEFGGLVVVTKLFGY